MLAVTVLAISGCGNKTKYANAPRPPLPINLTVYVNDTRVSVSPSSVGAGPVVFEVTNQSTKAESIAIQPAGGGDALASTGPINPQATAQVSVDLKTGSYTVATTPSGTTDAALAGPNSIQPATVHVGAQRAGAGSVLLSP